MAAGGGGGAGATPLQATIGLWQENVTDVGAVTDAATRQARVAAHQDRAEGVLHAVSGHDAGNHMGTPSTLGGWMDLVVEACMTASSFAHFLCAHVCMCGSMLVLCMFVCVWGVLGLRADTWVCLALLPKVDLIGAHRALQATGQVPANNPGLPAGTVALAGKPTPPTAPATAAAAPAALAASLASLPMQAPARSKARKDYFMSALAREPEQRWNQIRWCATTAEAAARARQQRRPLFIEMIVGRMGRATSNVC
jgi:hypothetical protein